ncbi:MAG: serpin family protein, partial [Anaerolineae bacterium]|nr:serpin family protein [Anaerolineae bacterium]
MNKIVYLCLVLAALVGLVACAPVSAAQEVQSDKPRIVSPSVTDADTAQLVHDNQAFALDLYRVLKSQDGNLFYSPYSISVALAMTYAGARNETARQMAEVMHFTLSQKQLHPTFNALDLALNSRGEGAQGKDGQGFRLNVVNAIWG